MSQVTVTLPDGSSRSVSSGTPVRDVAAEISPGLAKAAYAALVNGKLVDLSYPVEQDSAVRIVTDRSAEALPLLRHTLEMLREHAPNIRTVRIGTRVPFQDPSRINDAMLEMFAALRNFRFELGVNVNHPVEFWSESTAAKSGSGRITMPAPPP